MDLMFRHGMTPTQRLMWLKRLLGGGSAVLKTVMGAILHITDALAKPAKKLVVNIEPVQSGSGDPSPDNVRTITGWTGCNITHTGKNLMGGMDLANQVQRYMQSAVIDTTEKYVSFSAAAAVTDNVGDLVGIGYFKESTQYTFILTIYKTTGTGSNIRVLYTDGTYDLIPGVSAAKAKETIVFASDSGKTILRVAKNNSSGYTRIYYDESGIFEGVLTADDFEPYQGTTITYTFPQEAGTVYGGTLTFKNGSWELKVTHKIYEPDNNATGFLQGDGNVYVKNTTFIPKGFKYPIDVAESFSTHFKALSATSTTIPSFSISNSGTFAVNGAAGVTDTLENLRAFLSEQRIANTPVQFVLKLKDPITYTLTESQALTLLQGENNIWADASDSLKLTYYADGNVSTLEALNTLLGGRYTNLGTPDDVSDKEALQIILGETT